MKFRLTSRINDGLAEAPSFTVDVERIEKLLPVIEEELIADSLLPAPAGFSLLIERIE